MLLALILFHFSKIWMATLATPTDNGSIPHQLPHGDATTKSSSVTGWTASDWKAWSSQHAVQITQSRNGDAKIEDSFRIQDSSKGDTVGLCDGYWRPSTMPLSPHRNEMPLNIYYEHMRLMVSAAMTRLSQPGDYGLVPESVTKYLHRDLESRKLAKAFFAIDIPEPVPTDEQPCPDASLPTSGINLQRYQVARSMTINVLGNILARSATNNEEHKKPRVLCDSDWLEYRDLSSTVDHEVESKGSGSATLESWLVQHDEQFDDIDIYSYWWFLANVDGKRQYVKLDKRQFPASRDTNTVPFARNPDRQGQPDPCYFFQKGFTIWIDSRPFTTLCPSSFCRYLSDRSNLQDTEGSTAKHIAGLPEYADREKPVQFDVLPAEPQPFLHLEQVAVNALTWYRELFKIAGSLQGQERLKTLSDIEPVGKPDERREKWWETKSAWTLNPNRKSSGVRQSLRHALYDLAPSPPPEADTLNAVTNIENYVWHGLAAYLTGDKDWSTGFERPAGEPYHPAEMQWIHPDEVLHERKRPAKTTGETLERPGENKRKHGEAFAEGAGAQGGGWKKAEE